MTGLDWIQTRHAMDNQYRKATINAITVTVGIPAYNRGKVVVK